jgi:hypothetical protein
MFFIQMSTSRVDAISRISIQMNTYQIDIMRIRGVLQLGSQLSFWVGMTICNSCYIFTFMSAIRQVAWGAKHATHHIYNLTRMQLFAATLFQLLCNSPMTTTIMSCWRHFPSIHQNLTHGIMKSFWWFFLETLISIIHYDYSF